MSDWGRIHREFWDHPKAKRVGLEAIGLWTLCNSYAKYHRSGGLIEFDCPLLVGNEHLAAALVAVGLWIKVEKGYQFKDYEEWNADEQPVSTSARLVAEVIPPGHPFSVKKKLAYEVANLLKEGIEYQVVKAALKLWLGKSNAAPSWLPMLVSDVTRKGGAAERDAALREAWTTGDTKPLQRFGLVFTPPDLPLDVTTPGDARFYMLRAKRAWIEQLRKEL